MQSSSGLGARLDSGTMGGRSELQFWLSSKSSSDDNSEECMTGSAQFGGLVPAFMHGTVEKVSLKKTWNFGETRPVLGLNTRATLPA